MTSLKNEYYHHKNLYDDQLCQKISIAIKKSNVFANINPSHLIRKRFNVNLNFSQDIPPSKKPRDLLHLDESIIDSNNVRENTCKSPNLTLQNFLPKSDTLFLQSTPKSKDVSIKTECVVNENSDIPRNVYLPNNKNSENVSLHMKQATVSTTVNKSNILENHDNSPNRIQNRENVELTGKQTIQGKVTNKLNTTENREKSPKKDINKENIGIPVKHAIQPAAINKPNAQDNREKSPKKEGNREKQNKDLSNLATSLLPLPTVLFGKDSMLSALENGHHQDFINFFKEGIQIENEIIPEDLDELIDMIIIKKAFLIIPEFLSCIKNMTLYQETLANSFLKHQVELEKYKNEVINCLQSMINFKVESSIDLFIKVCANLNFWNKIWETLSKHKCGYLLPELYFNSCMDIFQNLEGPKSFISNETLTNIIFYITRNYPSKKSLYLADIWFYCLYHDINNNELNAVMDNCSPQHILDKFIDKLSRMNDPSFIFGMKLLSKNWNLIFNNTFCELFSKLISNKSDVRRCLFTIKDSIYALNRNPKQDYFDNFYLLGIRVMYFLNKKSLFTCSKSVYENFLKNYFVDIKRALLKVNSNDKFKLKWTMVECLISSADYEKALFVIKEFEVLKDLEATSKDYNRVKEKLPNLVWHLLNSSELLPVIVLFEQVVSIFIFNESIDSAYTKNCNEIFDLIIIKAYESNNIEVVKKIIYLLDLILSADIDFEISKESLRYLAVAAVKTNIPFKELLDFVDTCFKFNIFENIETSEDGFGSFVNANSDLTYEEIVILITWMCRVVKSNLVKSVQSQGASIRENIMKVCSIKFLLHPSNKSDAFCKEIGAETSFNEFLVKFTEALNNPKYLTHPIKFSTYSDTKDNGVKIVCDNRIVYNTIYYSDI